MNFSATWTVTAALVLTACGGNVVVDDPVVSSGGAPSTGSDTTTTSSSSGTPCVTSCLAGVMSGILPCDGLAFSSYGALVACSCGMGTEMAECKLSCGDNICKFTAPSADCSMCIQSSCGDELAACTAN